MYARRAAKNGDPNIVDGGHGSAEQDEGALL
jgi:hypothetical protein